MEKSSIPKYADNSGYLDDSSNLLSINFLILDMGKDPKTNEDNTQSGGQQDQGQGQDNTTQGVTSNEDYIRGGNLHELEDKGINPDILDDN